MPKSIVLRRGAIAAFATAALAVPATPAAALDVPCVAGIACSDAPAAKPACPGADLQPTGSNLATIRRATLCLVNRQRAKHHLRKLHANGALAGVATRYAQRMVAESFFDHVSPGGGTFVQRIERSAYLRPEDGYSLGENLAWGTGVLGSPRRIVRAWMHSPGHRANILNGSFRDAGIGIAVGVPVAGGGLGATYANEFGTRRRATIH